MCLSLLFIQCDIFFSRRNKNRPIREVRNDTLKPPGWGSVCGRPLCPTDVQQTGRIHRTPDCLFHQELNKTFLWPKDSRGNRWCVMDIQKTALNKVKSRWSALFVFEIKQKSPANDKRQNDRGCILRWLLYTGTPDFSRDTPAFVSTYITLTAATSVDWRWNRPVLLEEAAPQRPPVVRTGPP